MAPALSKFAIVGTAAAAVGVALAGNGKGNSSTVDVDAVTLRVRTRTRTQSKMIGALRNAAGSALSNLTSTLGGALPLLGQQNEVPEVEQHALLDLAKSHDFDEVRAALEKAFHDPSKGMDYATKLVNSVGGVDAKRYTVLHQAAYAEDKAFVQELLTKWGADPTVKSVLNRGTATEREGTADEVDTTEEIKQIIRAAQLHTRAHDFVNNLRFVPAPTSDLVDKLKVDPQTANRWANYADNTHPYITPKVKTLLEAYLAAKKQSKSTTDKERDVYGKMDSEGLVTRLLSKRPLTFYLDNDDTTLRDGTHFEGGYGYANPFKQISTAMNGVHLSGAENPMTFDDYMSYDEIALAALVNVAVPTDFINEGGRYNGGVPGEFGSFTDKGVMFAAVGARFEMPQEMEFKYMFVTREQNTEANGYGPNHSDDPVRKAWASFYEMPKGYFPTYDEAEADKSDRYEYVSGNVASGYLDTKALKIRLRASIEPFVFAAANYVDQAETLFQNTAKKAYLHATGIGSGVWAGSIGSGLITEKLIVQNYLEVLLENPSVAEKISDIDFSYFDPNLIPYIQDAASKF